MRHLVKVQATVEAGSKLKRDKAASTGTLLGIGGRPYRPSRMSVDLNRQSPLIAIFRGASPVRARPSRLRRSSAGFLTP